MSDQSYWKSKGDDRIQGVIYSEWKSRCYCLHFFFYLDIGYKLKDIFLRAHFDNPGQVYILVGFAGGSDGKGSTCNEGDLASIPGLGRSPGGGHGNPLQYSCLENLHGQRSLAGYSPWDHRVGNDCATKHSTYTLV